MFKSKIVPILMILFLVSAIFNYSTPALAAAEDSPNAHKAVVKIKTYALSENYNLVFSGSGSGVIISDDGLMLTNSYVTMVCRYR